ncbi:MAG: AbrB/MazE/SpoVT family DNA-binding domain-containing protein [Acidobacteria bacterium]|nr:AbrB/MazE/SpoVT family DNA-binding domain-containing protein [Acidobacteriota bacterium]
MPQVRSSKNRSLVIKADIAQELGIDPNRTFNVVRQGENLVLEPVKDPMEEEIRLYRNSRGDHKI